jgi:hypothetical protein
VDDVRIDRLTLQLSGLTEPQGRHLALLVTEGLAAARVPEGVSSATKVIKADLSTQEEGEDLAPLSERVVAEILRQLERSI